MKIRIRLQSRQLFLLLPGSTSLFLQSLRSVRAEPASYLCNIEAISWSVITTSGKRSGYVNEAADFKLNESTNPLAEFYEESYANVS